MSKSSAPVPGISVYEPFHDEVEEDNELRVPGESIPDSDDEEDEVVPVRRLVDFSVYQRRSLTLVPLGDLVGLDGEDSEDERDFGASGVVMAHADNDQEDTEDFSSEGDDPHGTERTVKLTQILEFNVHFVAGTNASNMMLDPLSLMSRLGGDNV